MNAPISSSAEFFLDAIDRLVAGELPEAQRVRLLAWLDEEPSRWRRCALAFLEAQVWEQAFRAPSPVEDFVRAAPRIPVERRFAPCDALLANGAPIEDICTERPARREKTAPARIGLAVAGVAAVAAVAFFAGLTAGDYGLGGAPQGASRKPTRGVSGDAAQGALRAAGAMSDAAKGQGESGDSPAAAPPGDTIGSSVSGTRVASVALTNAGGAAAPQLTLRLPVVEAGESAADAPPPISDYVRRQWAQRGWKLSPQRKFLPAKLDDGSQVVLPVNEVRMNYVGVQVY